MSARDKMDGETRRNRRAQLLLFSGLAALALLVLAFWLLASGGKAPRPGARIEAELAGPGTAEESWTRRSELRLGVIETRLSEMEAENRRLAGENRKLQERLAGNAADARAVIDRQIAVIKNYQQGQPAVAGGADTHRMPWEDPFPAAGAARPAPAREEPLPNGLPVRPASLIETFELDPVEEETDGPGAKPLGTWLPAGSHAEAVVLAGADASAGVASQGDPRPVLLRLTGPAWTAAEDGEALSVDIEGCTVTGAAHGDLSSEKVYARLRTLTCAGPEPGTVTETEVAGFVAGAGKAGVRGPVVSREGALVEKAFLAGVVSGVGQGVAGAFQPQAVATGGGSAAVANTGLADIGRAGLGSGASSAGRKVADYLIRRAEQYQPVIQLRAGTPVTVVFIEGARLGGRPGAAKERKND